MCLGLGQTIVHARGHLDVQCDRCRYVAIDGADYELNVLISITTELA